jgi:hypothetical protein
MVNLVINLGNWYIPPELGYTRQRVRVLVRLIAYFWDELEFQV